MLGVYEIERGREDLCFCAGLRAEGDEGEAEGHRDAGQRMLGVPRLGLSLGSAAAIAINADLVEDDVRDAIRAGAAAVSTSKPRREPTHQ